MPIRISEHRIALDTPINLAKSSNIASAATTNLVNATGNEIHITGSATITSFGTVPAGTQFFLIFDATPTLTYNATSMILNTGATNYTCAAGDRAIALSEGSGNWSVTVFKNDGTAIGATAIGTNRTITASDTAILADNGALITANHATVPIVLTIPQDSAVTWPTNAVLSVYQSGAAAVSFLAGTNVTLRNPGNLASATQYGTIIAYRVGANEWTLA